MSHGVVTCAGNRGWSQGVVTGAGHRGWSQQMVIGCGHSVIKKSNLKRPLNKFKQTSFNERNKRERERERERGNN